MKINLKFLTAVWLAKIENLKFLHSSDILNVWQKFLNTINLRNKRKQLNINGFTLIELVVVMAMIGIVSGATLKLVRFSDINKNLSLRTVEIKGIIRTAQTLALAPPIITNDSDKVLHVCGFVVQGDNNAKGLLKVMTVLPHDDDPVTCRTLTNINQICDNGTTTTCQPREEKNFEGFSITEGTGPIKIFFRAPYGKVLGSGDDTNIVIKQDDRDTYSKTIQINKQGKINVQ